MHEPRFVETSVTRLIFDVIEDAWDNRACSAIAGSPGIGKTMALEEYRRTNLGKAKLITATPILTAAPKEFYRRIAYSLGIYADRSLTEVEDAIFQSDLSQYVLLIDEAQNIPLKELRGLLYMTEMSGLTIILSGNDEVLKRVNVTKGPFMQIARRVMRREKIEAILDADADALSNSFGVEGLDCYALMRSIGARFHADGIVQVLTRAGKLAGPRHTIRLHDIHDALELLPFFKAAFDDKRRKISI